MGGSSMEKTASAGPGFLITKVRSRRVPAAMTPKSTFLALQMAGTRSRRPRSGGLREEPPSTARSGRAAMGAPGGRVGDLDGQRLLGRDLARHRRSAQTSAEKSPSGCSISGCSQRNLAGYVPGLFSTTVCDTVASSDPSGSGRRLLGRHAQVDGLDVADGHKLEGVRAVDGVRDRAAEAAAGATTRR